MWNVRNQGLFKDMWGDHVYDTYEEAYRVAVEGLSLYCMCPFGDQEMPGYRGDDIYYDWCE